MFPLKAVRKLDSTPIVTFALIGINILIFLWQTTLPEAELTRLYQTAGFVPCTGSVKVPSMFTSMFLHGGWLHLFGNMLYLFAFGPAVEDYLGKFWYPVFYLTAGVAGSLAHMVFNWNVCVPAIGASGAIMGVMGGFLLLYPATRISTIVLFWRIPVGVKEISAFYLLGGFFLLDLLNGLASLSPFAEKLTSGVAVWAHVGGFLVGFLMAFIAMTFKPLPPVDPIYLGKD
jgi:membrane associated rhomboid family serine protease